MVVPDHMGAACRDVKLENIFLTSRSLMKLGDFGLALSLKQEMPISPVGTVEYMAPEVVGSCTPASVFSLSVPVLIRPERMLLIKLVSGRSCLLHLSRSFENDPLAARLRQAQ